jgi:hypothetical protein
MSNGKRHNHSNYDTLRAFGNRMMRRILGSKRGGEKITEETAK